VSGLLVAAEDGAVAVTPATAGWRYVGFEALRLDGAVGRDTGQRELCLVVLAGRCDVRSSRGEWTGIGERETVFDGLPHAVYLPPATQWSVTGSAELGLCWAPATGGANARLIEPGDIEVEVRGHGAMERRIHPILMGDSPAESLLVTEVLTPAGNWSSYPPHKHDRDDPPEETYLEETYYHRIRPVSGFALQRVYSDDGSLDETVAVRDGDVVLVPRGYHTVSAPPGYELYYLNVMAGPRREWRITNDPDHEWLMTAEEA
jgi:5-deoxy-glucuronate isomerase